MNFINGPTLGILCLYPFFSNTNCTEKTVGISGIWARIVAAEGEHADPLTTTPAFLSNNLLVNPILQMITKLGTILESGRVTANGRQRPNS